MKPGDDPKPIPIPGTVSELYGSVTKLFSSKKGDWIECDLLHFWSNINVHTLYNVLKCCWSEKKQKNKGEIIIWHSAWKNVSFEEFESIPLFWPILSTNTDFHCNQLCNVYWNLHSPDGARERTLAQFCHCHLARCYNWAAAAAENCSEESNTQNSKNIRK